MTAPCRAVRVALAACAALMVAAGSGLAAPAEPPPSGYGGETFVDSAGCVFQRAELGGRVLWAELLGSDGAPVCGRVPSVPPSVLSDALPSIPPHRRGAAPDFPEPGAYVQVGAFRRTATADAVAGRLRAAGLPLLRQDFRTNGGLRILYAGPIPTGAPAEAALQDVRNLGFFDAFVWTAD